MMKRILRIIVLMLSIIAITGCNSDNEKVQEKLVGKVVNAVLNEEGDILINEDEITSVATFFNYDVDGITIGLIAVKGTDGIVRLAFNTCQACSPSPNAYFIQKGEYLECQNCGNRFHIDKIAMETGGCHPTIVEEISRKNGIITISSDYVKSYKDNFKNWNGPKV